uniref:L-aminoadipate-semialdehyde dehydrogenase-phosphopantetheinyl transferase n=1 Tax=Romanomermis culicivorax TaxID=13658 RepID=A0A915IQ15_ROMCU
MTGLKWSDVKLGRTSKGKPILIDENGVDSRFSFNMSHHGDYVLVVCENFSPSSMCGVDVMKIEIPTYKKTIDEYLDFMKSKFSRREFSTYGNYSNDYDKLILFYRYWCLKESYLKATGTGIHSKLSSLDFEVKTFDLPLDKTCRDTVLWIDGVKQLFTFEECWIDGNHFAAVCLSPVSTKDTTKFTSVDLKFLMDACTTLPNNVGLPDSVLRLYFDKKFKAVSNK